MIESESISICLDLEGLDLGDFDGNVRRLMSIVIIKNGKNMSEKKTVSHFIWMDLHHLWITINSCKYVWTLLRLFVNHGERARLIFFVIALVVSFHVVDENVSQSNWLRLPIAFTSNSIVFISIFVFFFKTTTTIACEFVVFFFMCCPTQAYVCMEKGIDRVLIFALEPVSLTTDRYFLRAFSARPLLYCWSATQIVGFLLLLW